MDDQHGHTAEDATTAPDEATGSGGGAVSRRGLFRSAGLSAALAALPLALAMNAGPAAAASRGAQAGPAAVPPPDSLPLTGGPDFPIGAFWPPHPFASDLSRFQEIAEAGFNFIVTGNYADDGNILIYQLGLAEQAGLKLLIATDEQIHIMSHDFAISDNPAADRSLTPTEAGEFYQIALNAYGPHSALAGFSHYDEPQPSWFGNLGRAVQVARSKAPQLLPYINMLAREDPNFYESFVSQVNPSLLSYDRYPLYSNGTDDPGYFNNWAIVRKVALEHDLPTWIYIQSVGYNSHRVPTASEILWQINVSLAYGCKGIQYFTYWTPDPARGEGYQPDSALISVDGRRTVRWTAARTINNNWLRPVGRQLKPLVSDSVEHANETPLPRGATGFTPGDYLASASGSAVVLGLFRSRDTSVQDRWLLVANRSHANTAQALIKANKAHVRAIEIFDPSTEGYRPNPHGTDIQSNLAAGAAQLLHLVHV